MVTTSVNNTFSPGVTMTPKNGFVSGNFAWQCTSLNPDMVSVETTSLEPDATGKKYAATATLTAKAPGTTYICLKTWTGASDSESVNIKRCKVTVTSPAESITTDAGKSITLRQGAYQYVDAGVAHRPAELVHGGDGGRQVGGDVQVVKARHHVGGQRDGIAVGAVLIDDNDLTARQIQFLAEYIRRLCRRNDPDGVCGLSKDADGHQVLKLLPVIGGIGGLNDAHAVPNSRYLAAVRVQRHSVS